MDLQVCQSGNHSRWQIRLLHCAKYTERSTYLRDNQPNKGKNSYYYVRGEQDNGEIVWVSPFWITYTGN